MTLGPASPDGEFALLLDGPAWTKWAGCASEEGAHKGRPYEIDIA